MKKAILILAIIAGLYAIHGAMTIETVESLTSERQERLDEVMDQ